MTAKPFLRWVGGKTQLLHEIVPALAHGTILPGSYVEPFVGAGAVFFALAEHGLLRKGMVTIGDANERLINTYRALRRDAAEVVKVLEEIRNEHLKDPLACYYRYREFESVIGALYGDFEGAARFIYLNRTGFNGLYRVNSKGKYNTPFGKKSDFNVGKENLLAVGELLREFAVGILDEDFEDTVSGYGEYCTIYFDPPYAPVKKTSFTRYSGEFGDGAQMRLAATFNRLVSAGAHCVLSNSDTEEMCALYANHYIETVYARRNVNSKGDGRGKVTEILVTGVKK